MITARAQYDDRPVVASDISFEGDKGLTKVADAKDTDINMLFKRFERTGQLPDMIVKEPRYGDFSAVPDYQEALQIVLHANEQFENLDARLRNKFDNDPAKFLAFMEDEKNIDEIERMGLLKPEAVEKRAAARKKASEEAIAKDKIAKEQAEKELIAKIKAEITK